MHAADDYDFFSQACRINKLAFEGQSDVSKLDVASNLLVASQ